MSAETLDHKLKTMSKEKWRSRMTSILGEPSVRQILAPFQVMIGEEYVLPRTNEQRVQDIVDANHAVKIQWGNSKYRNNRFLRLIDELKNNPEALIIIRDDSEHMAGIFNRKFTSTQNLLKTSDTIHLPRYSTDIQAIGEKATPRAGLETALLKRFSHPQSLNERYVGYDFRQPNQSENVVVVRLTDCIRGAELFVNAQLPLTITEAGEPKDRKYSHSRYPYGGSAHVNVPSASGAVAEIGPEAQYLIRLSSMPYRFPDANVPNAEYAAWMYLDINHNCPKTHWDNAMHRHDNEQGRFFATTPDETLMCFHTVAAYLRMMKKLTESEDPEDPKLEICPFVMPTEKLYESYHRLRTGVLKEVPNSDGANSYMPLSLTDIEIILWSQVGNMALRQNQTARRREGPIVKVMDECFMDEADYLVEKEDNLEFAFSSYMKR